MLTLIILTALESKFAVSPITVNADGDGAASFTFTTGLGAASPDTNAIKVEVFRSPIALPSSETTPDLTDENMRSACFSRGGTLMGEIAEGINMPDSPDDNEARTFLVTDGTTGLNTVGPNTEGDDEDEPTFKKFEITNFRDIIDAETTSGVLDNDELIREVEAATAGTRKLEVLVCVKATLTTTPSGGSAIDANYEVSTFESTRCRVWTPSLCHAMATCHANTHV